MGGRDKGNESGALSVRLVAGKGGNGSGGRVECTYAMLPSGNTASLSSVGNLTFEFTRELERIRMTAAIFFCLAKSGCLRPSFDRYHWGTILDLPA